MEGGQKISPCRIFHVTKIAARGNFFALLAHRKLFCLYINFSGKGNFFALLAHCKLFCLFINFSGKGNFFALLAHRKLFCLFINFSGKGKFLCAIATKPYNNSVADKIMRLKQKRALVALRPAPEKRGHITHYQSFKRHDNLRGGESGKA